VSKPPAKKRTFEVRLEISLLQEQKAPLLSAEISVQETGSWEILCEFPEQLVRFPTFSTEGQVGYHGDEPMFEDDDFKGNTGASAHKGHWLTLAERAFRPVDKLDYLIRRRVSQSPSLYPMQTDAPLNELQRAISGSGVRSNTTYARPALRTSQKS
jgi:hypothetical protein